MRASQFSLTLVACALLACSAAPPHAQTANAAQQPHKSASPKKETPEVVDRPSEQPLVASAELDAESASSVTEETVDEPEAPAMETALPQSCEQSGKFCLPESGFVERLCEGKYPDLAVFMMQQHQPWTRGYIRVKQVGAVNTYGGPSGQAKLVFGEEVLVLKSGPQNTGRMQMTGMGGFVVLRWDGTCATLAQHELVTWVPGLPRHAPLVWKYLGSSTQEALLKSTRIKTARKKHRRECRGVSMGRSSQCIKATDRLNEAIVVAIRTGMAIPKPEYLP